MVIETVRGIIRQRFAHLTPRELLELGIKRLSKSKNDDAPNFLFEDAYLQSLDGSDKDMQNVCSVGLAAWYIFSKKPDKVETGIELLGKTLETTTSSQLIPRIHLNLAVAHEFKGEYVKAIAYYKKFYKAARHVPVFRNKKADVQFRMGVCYQKLSIWESALTAFKSADKQYYNNRMPLNQVKSLLRQAEIYLRTTETTEECLRLGRHCAHVLQKVTMPSLELAMLYHEVGLIFARCHLHAYAVDSFAAAYHYLKLSPSHTEKQEAVILQNWGAALIARSEFKSAEHVLSIAIELNTNINSQAQGECYYNLGTALYKLKKYDRAYFLLLQAVQAGRETGDVNLCRQSYELLAELRQITQQYDDVKKYLQGGILVDPSLPSQLERKRLWDLHSTFDPRQPPGGGGAGGGSGGGGGPLSSSGNGALRRSPSISSSGSLPSNTSHFFVYPPGTRRRTRRPESMFPGRNPHGGTFEPTLYSDAGVVAAVQRHLSHTRSTGASIRRRGDHGDADESYVSWTSTFESERTSPESSDDGTMHESDQEEDKKKTTKLPSTSPRTKNDDTDRDLTSDDDKTRRQPSDKNTKSGPNRKRINKVTDDSDQGK